MIPLAQKIKNLLNFRKIKIEESSALYASNSLYNLALSLIGIYIPIYLFNVTAGNKIFHSHYVLNGIIWICLYSALISVFLVLTTVLFEEKLFSKLKLKKSLFFGVVLLIVHLFLLMLAERNFYLIIVAAMVGGVEATLYWIPYHIFFVKRADDGDSKYGTEVGKRGFYGGLVASLGPLLGGLIITQLGFSFLYGLAIIILLASSLPILLYVTESSHREHKIKDVFKNFLFNKQYLTTNVAFFGKVGSDVISGIFWSLVLYFGLKSFVEIGTLNTLSGIFATSLLLVVGRNLDLKGSMKIHSVGVLINSVLGVTRSFIVKPSHLYLNNIGTTINSPAYNTPFMTKVYEKASKSGSISDFLVYRELILHASKAVILGLVCVCILLTGTWRWVFLVAAAGSAISLLIEK